MSYIKTARHIMMFMIIIALLSAPVMAAKPAWAGKGKDTTTDTTAATKSTATSTGGKTTTSTAPVKETVVIVQNITSQESGLEWDKIGAIVSSIAIVGAAIGWFITRKSRGLTSKYLRDLDKAFHTYKDNASKCESAIYNVKEEIERDFSKGKLNDQALALLETRVDKYLGNIRKDVLKTNVELPADILRDLDKMLKDGFISEEEYKKFASMDIASLSKKDQEKLKSLVQKWRKK